MAARIHRMLLLAFIALGSRLFAESPALELFYLPGCHDCLEFEESLRDRILPALSNLGIRPEVRLIDVLTPSGFERLNAETRRLGWNYRGVPLLKAGDSFFYGDALYASDTVRRIAEALEESAARAMATPVPAVDEARPAVPAVGEIGPTDSGQAAAVPSLNLWVVLGAGLVDGVNPCALATLLFMVSALALGGKSRAAVASIGASFILGVYLAYFLIGLGLLRIGALAASLPTLRMVIRVLTAAGLAVLGVLSLRDWRAAKMGRTKDISLKLPNSTIRRVHSIIREKASLWASGFGAAGLGVLVSITEFVCTGQVYLPTLVYISQRNAGGALGLIAAYNAAFVLPLAGVFVLVMLGFSHARLMELFKRNLAASKLALAIFFLAFGVLMAVGI